MGYTCPVSTLFCEAASTNKHQILCFTNTPHTLLYARDHVLHHRNSVSICLAKVRPDKR